MESVIGSADVVRKRCILRRSLSSCWRCSSFFLKEAFHGLGHVPLGKHPELCDIGSGILTGIIVKKTDYGGLRRRKTVFSAYVFFQQIFVKFDDSSYIDEKISCSTHAPLLISSKKNCFNRNYYTPDFGEIKGENKFVRVAMGE